MKKSAIDSLKPVSPGINGNGVTVCPECGTAIKRCEGCPPIPVKPDDKVWEDMAAQMSRNSDYYRGLVVKIGKMIGEKAYISAAFILRSVGLLCYYRAVMIARAKGYMLI